MNAERILAMLYEMALVIGGEIRVEPLCTKTLQRLLFHTSFPCGMVLLNGAEPCPAESSGNVAMYLVKAIGDFTLSQCNKTTLSIPAPLVSGTVELLEAPEMLECLPCRKGYYRVFLRLPFGSSGTILLLAPHLPVSDLPVTEVFQPILGNFAKAFHLCRNNEAYTQQIEEDLRTRSVAIDQCPASVFITDLTPSIQYVNPHFCRVTGYAADEVLGRNPRLLQSGLTDRRVYDELWTSLRQGKAWSGEFINKRKNGELYWEEAHIAPVHDTAGRSTHYVAVKLDVTERKRIQTELERSREQYELAVAGSNDGIWDWNIQNNSLYLSPRWKDQIGHLDHELPNHFASFQTNLHPEDEPRVMAYTQEYLAGRIDGYEIEFRLRHKDGTWRWILARGASVPGPDGTPIRMAGSHTDITERKQHEHELELARDAAEAASRAKSEFLTNTSHELRTPMNGIMGMAQLLDFTELADKQREFVKNILASSHQLLSIINDILDLAKIESGRIELNCAEFRLRNTISDIIKTQKSLIQQKGLSMQVYIPTTVPDTLTGDQLRLKQILLNLLGNAIKFTEKGSIRISVAVTERRDDVALLQIGVTDTGIGISSEARERIFLPFVQADSSNTRQYGGTGLGLAICTRLTELMGGKIWVESIEGRGSTFFLQIPFAVNET